MKRFILLVLMVAAISHATPFVSGTKTVFVKGTTTVFTNTAPPVVTVPNPTVLWYPLQENVGSQWNPGGTTTAGYAYIDGGGGVGTSWVAGPAGTDYGFSFNTGNHFMYTLNPISGLPGTPMTMSVWLKTPTAAATYAIFGYNVTCCCPQLRTDNNSIGFFSASSFVVNYATTPIGNNVWTMASFTIDASGNYIFYINGAAAGSGNTSQWNSTGFSNPINTIGAEATLPANPYQGAISHMGIWNTVLSPAQVTKLYSTYGP